MGAKNHGVIMPDCDKEDALNALTSAAFGASGQRCMALTTGIFVGGAQKWIEELIPKANGLVIGDGSQKGVDMAPVCYSELYDRIVQNIRTASI
jgi:malonate-semialdehyde dehydrogenase (acetylating)/methylmalonate-semialdehyde dehydrogenase